MKRLCAFPVCTGILIFLIQACGSSAPATIEDIPEAYYEAIRTNDTDSIRQLTTQAAAAEVLQIAQAAQEYEVEISNIKIIGITDADSDHKQIRVQYITEFRPKGGGNVIDTSQHTQLMHIIKTGDRWLVDQVDDED
jgi:hypothetical protein